MTDNEKEHEVLFQRMNDVERVSTQNETGIKHLVKIVDRHVDKEEQDRRDDQLQMQEMVRSLEELHHTVLIRPALTVEQVAYVSSLTKRQEKKAEFWEAVKLHTIKAAGGIVGRWVPGIIIGIGAIVVVGGERALEYIQQLIQW